MSRYRQRPSLRERQWTPLAVEEQLRTSGEVAPHQRVRVKRYRRRPTHRVWVTLDLRSDDGRFQRQIQLADGPAAVRDALEQPVEAPVTARHATLPELPRALRARIEGLVAEQRELGYDVDLAEVRYLQDAALRVRYRVVGRPWTVVWLSASEPCVLGYPAWKRQWTAPPPSHASTAWGTYRGARVYGSVSGVLLLVLAGLLCLLVDLW